MESEAIESVLITGDFFSTMDEINAIESQLKWIPADREKVEGALKAVMDGETIFGVSREVLADLIMEAVKAPKKEAGISADSNLGEAS